MCTAAVIALVHRLHAALLQGSIPYVPILRAPYYVWIGRVPQLATIMAESKTEAPSGFPATFLYTQSWEDPRPDMQVGKLTLSGAPLLQSSAASEDALMHAHLFNNLLLIIHTMCVIPSFTLSSSLPALSLPQSRRHSLWNCQPVDVTSLTPERYGHR